jgi:hypothetical protein
MPAKSTAGLFGDCPCTFVPNASGVPNICFAIVSFALLFTAEVELAVRAAACPSGATRVALGSVDNLTTAVIRVDRALGEEKAEVLEFLGDGDETC